MKVIQKFSVYNITNEHQNIMEFFCNNVVTDLKLFGDGADFSGAMESVSYLTFTMCFMSKYVYVMQSRKEACVIRLNGSF